MSMNNIFNDISSIYLEEVLKPQLGKSSEGGEGDKAPEGSGDEGSAKRVRQAVYDIRYRARREDIPVDQAFNQYMSHTSMNAIEKTEVKEKLGIGAGAPVKEDAKPGEHYLRVVPKRGTGEKAYTRKFDPASQTDRLKRHKLETRGIKTYVTKHGSPYDGSKDQDGDGDNDFADVMSARMQASGVDKDDANKKVAKKPYNKGKKQDQHESFSNWRMDLFEINKDELTGQKKTEIKEDPKINNKVTINPSLEESIEKMGGEVIDVLDITEEFLSEEVQVATEYFYEQGLNEHGVNILIERLGVDEFCNFVQDISEEYVLLEWRRGAGGTKVRGSQLSKGGKHISTLKGGAKTSAIKGTAEHKGRKAEKETSDGKGSGMTAALKSQSEKARRVAVKTAKVKQSETKSSEKETKKGIGAAISGALGHIKKRAQQDTELLKKSVQTARDVATRRGAEAKAVYDAVRERGKTAEQSPQATRARRKAKVAAGRAAQAAAPVVKKAVKAGAAAAGAGAGSLKAGKSPAQAAGRAAGTFVRKMTKEELELQEKAESEQQQKLFGLALSVKRGQTPRSEASAEVLKIVDGMSEKKIRDFAKTKHEGLPKKVEEAIAPATQVTQTQQNTQDMQQKQKQQKLQQQKQQQKPQQNTSAINQVLMAKQRVDAAQKDLAMKQKTAAQKNVNLQSLSASYQPEGESIEELNRYEKETGTSSGSLNMPKGRPTKSGGDTDPALRAVRKTMRKMTGKPAGQQKKVPGKKPPAAGEYGSGVKSPAQKVALRRAAAQRAQDMMHSRFD